MHGRTTIFSAGEPLPVRPGGRFEPTSPPGRWAARSPSLKPRQRAFRRPKCRRTHDRYLDQCRTIIVFVPKSALHLAVPSMKHGKRSSAARR
ncbi:hypothetical protein AJ88_39890 [Mesorhizobium amorphae CCBAU 01583]|nr:hypothetical protein AJ88_39890 [Mesorhizobium amorphae CCBAU 01583]